MSECSVTDCRAVVHARGLCNSHYGKWRQKNVLPSAARPVCSVDGCDRPFRTRGLCDLHYQRLRSSGTFALVERDWRKRFWAKVEKTEECWLWTAALNRDGYGIFGFDSHTVRGAHRIAYELLIGPIPDGRQLDHLCRVRRCVNPSHLEAVSSGENTRRGLPAMSKGLTHCPQNHPYDEANTYWYRGWKQCRICRREYSRASRARRSAA